MSAELRDIELAGLTEERLRAALVEQQAVTTERRRRLAWCDRFAEQQRVNGIAQCDFARMAEVRVLVRYGERQVARIDEALRRIEDSRAYELAVERARALRAVEARRAR